MFVPFAVTTLLSSSPVATSLKVSPTPVAATTTAMSAATAPAPCNVTISGSLVAWFPVTLDFVGPTADEADINPNPFLDYRLFLTLVSPSSNVYYASGFFDGDGQGGGNGNVWRVRYAPEEAGTWNYTVSFKSGQDVAVSTNPADGVGWFPLHNCTGSFSVTTLDPNADGFYRYGLLEYVGAHYLKFRDGPYFIKTGANSPENFMGYRGFDDAFDHGGFNFGLPNGLHEYPTHVADFGPPSGGGLGDANDPLWVNNLIPSYDSKGIIGALNYLASRHVNSIYFLPMNLFGDGRETYPFVDPPVPGSTPDPLDQEYKLHYDISKLGQWNLAFDHATRRGIQLQFVLAETETNNEQLLDGGGLGVQRKLFYREMIARFGHSLALKWNLCEESDYGEFNHEAFADYIQILDPYKHPVGFHTHALQQCCPQYTQYDQVLGDPSFCITSIQCPYDGVDNTVEYWRTRSATFVPAPPDVPKPWVIDIDECFINASDALADGNATDRRKRALYDVLFSGGNIEWYFAGPDPVTGDLNTEDFRTRQDMWDYQWYARKFMEGQLPFWQMNPDDNRVTNESSTFGGAEVFLKPNFAYAVYFPAATATGDINLNDAHGLFRKRWYNPRTGMFEGNATFLNGGSVVPCGSPPSSPNEDWVLLYKKMQPLPVF